MNNSYNPRVPGLTGATKHNRSPIDNQRTTTEMVYDVFYALSTGMTDRAKRAVIDGVLKDWPKQDGKYEGVRFWSREAVKVYKDSKKKDPSYKANGETFTHEHVMPMTCILEHLLEKHKPTVEDVRALLFNGLNVAVVTKAEDDLLKGSGLKQKMPNGFYTLNEEPLYANPWSRYIETNIEIYDCWWKEKELDTYWDHNIRNEANIYIPEEKVKFYVVTNISPYPFDALLSLKTGRVFPTFVLTAKGESPIQGNIISYYIINQAGEQIPCTHRDDEEYGDVYEIK